METIEYRTIDKASWPRGAWDNEPDKIQWQDEETGLPCLAVRHRNAGHWCGYVGVDETHPWHRKDYSQCLCDHGEDCWSHSPEALTEVHGGLTFADACREGDTEAEGVCHIPGDGEPDHVWWFGFDCAHCCDISPARNDNYWRHEPEGQYRTLEYVQDQCRSLARQLAAVTPESHTHRSE